MPEITNRFAAAVLLVFSLAILIYVMTASWTFLEMRDGMRIGSFPLAYVGFCILFAGLIGVGSTAAEPLENVRSLNWVGVGKIAVFILGGLALTFNHETFGFVAMGTLFVAVVSWFMGQRNILVIVLYSLAICAALYGLFTLLGFELTVFPSFSSLGA